MLSIKKLSIMAVLAAMAVIGTGCSEKSSIMAPYEFDSQNDFNAAGSSTSFSSSSTLLAAVRGGSNVNGGNGANGNEIDYEMELVDHSYDGSVTKLTYRIVSGRAPSISHVTLEIPCVTGGEIAYSSDPLTEVGNDPTTDITGVKFDSGYNDGEERLVTLVLEGQYAVGPITVAVKAGNGFVLGVVDGPLCGVTPPAADVTINGTVFFDVNGNGVQDTDEPGIPGIPVYLSNGSSVNSGNDGGYLFVVTPGNYTVSVSALEGFNNTTPVSVDVRVVSNNVNIDFGNGLNLNYLIGQTANGYTIGYWKTNLDKAISGKVKGIQISAATLSSYIAGISVFALEPLNVTTLKGAYDVLSANGSDPVLLLSKQLMGSELNLMNGAYIGGNVLYTSMFLYYGEYLIKYSGSYSSSDLLYAKDLYDAYNNSHGGTITLN